jgi:hypothetical protein
MEIMDLDRENPLNNREVVLIPILKNEAVS